MTDRTRPARAAAAKTAAATDGAAEAAADAREDALAAIDNDEVDTLTSADYTVAFSPRQVAVGLAIVAGLVALVAARRRRRRDGSGEG